MAGNKDLLEERIRPSFDVKTFSKFLYGEQGIERRLKISALVESIPDLDGKNPDFLSREERYKEVMRKTVVMIRNFGNLDLDGLEESALFRSEVLGLEVSPVELHFVMFLPTLQGQCSPEQFDKFYPRALTFDMIGTYAQTELGHGTNLQKLETTATYDPKTQEFVIHSPTLTATKWWPGNLGKSTNWVVVVAQLYTQGKCHGTHSFLVQIRDGVTHQPMPGITVGDIGPKMGMVSNDNGFLRFNHVRIPRDQLLMRFAKVEPDGTYIPPVHKKVGYGSMLFVRAIMIRNLAVHLAQACTIAVRYSCVRRQGEKIPGTQEEKVLNYQTQQYKLFPYVASAIAFYFAGDHIMEVYQVVTKNVQSGNVELLPQLHALSSGLKSLITWEVVRGMEICRLACGGHGFSLSSGLPQLYDNYTAACTYEGENTVLQLQVARSLVKVYRNWSGVSVEGDPYAYLFRPRISHSRLNQELRFDDLLDLYQHASQRLLSDLVQQLEGYKSRGVSPENAWDLCSVLATRVAKMHVLQFVVDNFIQKVASCQDSTIRPVLSRLCRLYALFGIFKRPGKFLEDGFMTSQQLMLVREGLFELLALLRKDIVLVVDAFMFSDRQLRSVLGRYDGNVYENLLKWAQSSPMNQKEVMDCHQELLGQIIQEARSRL